jgi:hypothetical protein
MTLTLMEVAEGRRLPMYTLKAIMSSVMTLPPMCVRACVYVYLPIHSRKFYFIHPPTATKCHHPLSPLELLNFLIFMLNDFLLRLFLFTSFTACWKEIKFTETRGRGRGARERERDRRQVWVRIDVRSLRQLSWIDVISNNEI